MTMRSATMTIMTAALALALAACQKPAGDAQGDAAQPSGRAGDLVGTWTTDAPVDFSGEGLRTQMVGGKTVYAADRKFTYSGRLTIFGNKLPVDGLNFQVAGEGDWTRDGNQLTEDYTRVTITPEAGNPTLARLARQMADEMVAEAPTRSRIVELSDSRMELSDEASDRRTSYSRAPAAAR